MFRDKELDEFLWGWNKTGKFNEKLRMLWSIPSYKMAVEKFPYLRKNLRVSGATGMDKYSLLRNEKYNKKGFKKVIGYAGFDFNRLLGRKVENLEGIQADAEFFKYIRNELRVISDILNFIIRNNKDILFLIKSHPGDQGQIPLEIAGLENLKNVELIKSPLEPIAKVIASSDIWLCGNSTTVIDAWLSKKPTISFVGKDQEKAIPALNASILSREKTEINGYIQEFYERNSILAFDSFKIEREQHISNLIGFSDGLNHIRYMSFLKPFIEAIERQEQASGNWKIPPKEKFYETLKHYVYLVSSGRHNIPILSRWARIYERFKARDLQNFWNTHEADIDDFYKKNREEIDYLYDNYKKTFESEFSSNSSKLMNYSHNG